MTENKLTKLWYIILSVKWWIILGLGALVPLTIGGWAVADTALCRTLVVRFVNFCEGFFPHIDTFEGIILLIVGICGVLLGGYGVFHRYVHLAYPMGKRSYYRAKVLQQGPKIVVIGGGSGQATLLKGLKEYTRNLTAVVTVGDDGGSSGRLREEFGVIPLGDIRSCIVALSDREELTEQLLDYRFSGTSELDGHSLGNLLLLAMSDLKGGSARAVADINEFLYLRGQVLPIADEPLTLCGKLKDGSIVKGECNLRHAPGEIVELKIEPPTATALPAVLEAIEQADAIILGPGSLYTSVLPNLLVNPLAETLRRSRAAVFYVTNVMTEAGETDNFRASDHLRRVVDILGEGVVDYCILNSNFAIDPEVLARYQAEEAQVVAYDKENLEKLAVKVIAADLLKDNGVLRHDSAKLANLVIKTIYSDYRYYDKRRVWRKNIRRVD